MITPRFKLSQDADTFTIVIRAPYCSLKELDVHVDDVDYVFYCKPYYLRLKLPGLVSIDPTHSKFDADTGEFTYTHAKQTPGEHFPNLEFITQFLCPKVEVRENGRKIEVLSSSAPPADASVEIDEKYGFAQRGGYNFNFISAEFSEVFELNPYEVPLTERRTVHVQHEAQKFDFDHYVCDFIECDEIDYIRQMPSPWTKDVGDLAFTPTELDFLKDLPNIVYEISAQQRQYVYNGLLDILYAYCYDKRTTYNEGNCESGWTISKLAATLTAFAAFETPREALISAMRRAVIFPLYRNFELAKRVLDDVKEVLHAGEVRIVKILIELNEIFLKGDSARYILNHLFIKDYAIYAQKWDRCEWQKVADTVSDMQITKDELGLGLEEIDLMAEGYEHEEGENSEATDTEEEEEEEENLTATLGAMTLAEGALDSDDDPEPKPSLPHTGEQQHAVV